MIENSKTLHNGLEYSSKNQFHSEGNFLCLLESLKLKWTLTYHNHRSNLDFKFRTLVGTYLLVIMDIFSLNNYSKTAQNSIEQMTKVQYSESFRSTPFLNLKLRLGTLSTLHCHCFQNPIVNLSVFKQPKWNFRFQIYCL